MSFSIPAGVGFAEALAARLLTETAADPLALSGYRVLLPTRRACRALQETFLRLSEGQAAAAAAPASLWAISMPMS